MNSDNAPNPYLSIVVPAYNEQARIEHSLNKLVTYLSRQDYHWEVLIADDGSDDDGPDRTDVEPAGAQKRAQQHAVLVRQPIMLGRDAPSRAEPRALEQAKLDCGVADVDRQ